MYQTVNGSKKEMVMAIGMESTFHMCGRKQIFELHNVGVMGPTVHCLHLFNTQFSSHLYPIPSFSLQ